MQSHFQKKKIGKLQEVPFFFYFQTGLGAEEDLKITTNSVCFKKT